VAAAHDPLANIRACAAQVDDARRLACYDRQFRALDVTPPSQPQTAPNSASAAPVTAEQRFGMNGQVERNDPAAQAPKLGRLAGRVVVVGHKPHGEVIFKLENGQVWEEADGETPVELKVGATVTIDAGVMGAYWLSAPGGSVRVKRTR
jgi:hypothetical protein